MPKGGARPNSGPKKGAIYKKTLDELALQDELRARLAPHAQEVANALANKAKTGDVFAIKEFNERYVGKPRERKEVDLILPVPILNNLIDVISSDDSNEEDLIAEEEN